MEENRTYNLIATAAFGIESVVRRELNWLGCEDAAIENGSVHFRGDAALICRANLWLRCADRVLINMGTFKAVTFEELFQGTKAIPWETLIGETGAFPVSGKSVKSTLHSVPNCQKIVKKAIAERLKSVYQKDWLEETGAVYKIEVGILNDVVTLTVDTSGAGLHKRGYRSKAGEAPIKETLACAMLYISRWRGDRVLLDPLCGSGTIPIEAAMIACNIAPGLRRNFACESWPQIPPDVWHRVREEARAAARPETETRIYGSDLDYFALKLAEEHAKNAGVEGKIHFQKIDLCNTSSRYKYGFIITNPPYGERLSDKRGVEALYQKMGAHFKKFDTWSYYVITSHPDFEKYFGRRADKKRKLYNGMLKCDYYQFFGPKPPKTGSSEPKMSF